MGGTGLSFKIEMETSDKKDTKHFFKVNKISVDVKNLKLKVKKSKHKLLFSLFKPLLLKVMRPAIQKAAEKQIRSNLEQLDATIFAVRQEVQRAEAELKANPDPATAQNVYQRYASAINKQVLQARKKKAELETRASETKANVAVTAHDSIFPDIKLPGGISSKATEYKDLAAKGERWESPVFSIGSAKESSNVPKIAAVTRKPHIVTNGGLRKDQPVFTQGLSQSAPVDPSIPLPLNGTALNGGAVNGNSGYGY